MAALYISYDGLLEPLGQSQVLPYLRRLASNRPVTLVTYEKEEDFTDAAKMDRMRAETRSAGIRWVPLRYHKRPTLVATGYDIVAGIVVCIRLHRQSRFRLIHARSYVPALLGITLKRLLKIPLIFDTRGFWLDGRIEAGSIREGSIVGRFGRWLERRFVLDADVIFTLTRAAADRIRSWPSVAGRDLRLEVVPTCTDLSLFRPRPESVPPREDQALTLGYVGNAGPGYLFESVLDLYQAVVAIEPGARLRIVNRNDHARIREALGRRHLDDAAVTLSRSEHFEVHRHLWEMDVGLFFNRWHPTADGERNAGSAGPTAQVGNVPTKIGEYLACGIPCVGNTGGGPVAEEVEREGVAVLMHGLDPMAMRQAALRTVALARRQGIQQLCVDVAQRLFSLDVGVATYEAIYRELESGIKQTAPRT